MVAGMLMPLDRLRAIYEIFFRDGVMVAKNDERPQSRHDEVPGVTNLQVTKAMGSLKSRGFVRETFVWRHCYWYLTNEGIVYLRQYLHLPPEIVPASLQRVRRPMPAPGLPRRAPAPGVQSVHGPTSYVPKPEGERQEYRRREEPASQKEQGDMSGLFSARAQEQNKREGGWQRQEGQVSLKGDMGQMSQAHKIVEEKWGSRQDQRGEEAWRTSGRGEERVGFQRIISPATAFSETLVVDKKLGETQQRRGDTKRNSVKENAELQRVPSAITSTHVSLGVEKRKGERPEQWRGEGSEKIVKEDRVELEKTSTSRPQKAEPKLGDRQGQIREEARKLVKDEVADLHTLTSALEPLVTGHKQEVRQDNRKEEEGELEGERSIGGTARARTKQEARQEKGKGPAAGQKEDVKKERQGESPVTLTPETPKGETGPETPRLEKGKGAGKGQKEQSGARKEAQAEVQGAPSPVTPTFQPPTAGTTLEVRQDKRRGEAEGQKEEIKTKTEKGEAAETHKVLKPAVSEPPKAKPKQEGRQETTGKEARKRVEKEAAVVQVTPSPVTSDPEHLKTEAILGTRQEKRKGEAKGQKEEVKKEESVQIQQTPSPAASEPPKPETKQVTRQDKRREGVKNKQEKEEIKEAAKVTSPVTCTPEPAKAESKQEKGKEAKTRVDIEGTQKSVLQVALSSVISALQPPKAETKVERKEEIKGQTEKEKVQNEAGKEKTAEVQVAPGPVTSDPKLPEPETQQEAAQEKGVKSKVDKFNNETVEEKGVELQKSVGPITSDPAHQKTENKQEIRQENRREENKIKGEMEEADRNIEVEEDKRKREKREAVEIQKFLSEVISASEPPKAETKQDIRQKKGSEWAEREVAGLHRVLSPVAYENKHGHVQKMEEVIEIKMATSTVTTSTYKHVLLEIRQEGSREQSKPEDMKLGDIKAVSHTAACTQNPPVSETQDAKQQEDWPMVSDSKGTRQQEPMTEDKGQLFKTQRDLQVVSVTTTITQSPPVSGETHMSSKKLEAEVKQEDPQVVSDADTCIKKLPVSEDTQGTRQQKTMLEVKDREDLPEANKQKDLPAGSAADTCVNTFPVSEDTQGTRQQKPRLEVKDLQEANKQEGLQVALETATFTQNPPVSKETQQEPRPEREDEAEKVASGQDVTTLGVSRPDSDSTPDEGWYHRPLAAH
ncbi:hypothetical protein FKM82_021817 [Ascaphus truei]